MTSELSLTGGLYQIVGILCAAIGIVQTRRAWSDSMGIARASNSIVHGVIISIGRLLRRLFPRLVKPKPAYLEGSASATSSASGKVEIQIGAIGLTVEDKVQWLVSRVQTQMVQITTLQSKLQDVRASLVAQENDTHDRISAVESRTRSKISALATGGLRLQTWGVLFLILGTIQLMWGASIHTPPNETILIILVVALYFFTVAAVLSVYFRSPDGGLKAEASTSF